MPRNHATASTWRVTPEDYLATRPPACPVPVRSRLSSRYLTMRDGVRIAMDIYMPANFEAGVVLPTILVLTPYYRRFKLTQGAPDGVEVSPNIAAYRDMFVPRGYAMVVVDVRGTGASFGVRDSFRSPVERDDYREIVDWVIAQPWSDGSVGATGISYLGAASDFLASTGHPAIKAIAPLFSVWDTYSNHYFPGGLLQNRLAIEYDRLMVGLDHDNRDVIKAFPSYAHPSFDGPHPVDEDADGTAAREAVKQHLGNFRMPDFIREFDFKGDGLPYDPAFTSDAFSPYAYAHEIREDVAVYSISGWMDGGGFANGAVSRFLSLPNPKRHLLLGPWDHGARSNCSPFNDPSVPAFPVLGEVLRFFDHYLMGRDTGLHRESRVHYFAIQAEAWRESEAWPPRQDSTTLYLSGEGGLSPWAPAAAKATYRVDPTIGTGADTRYERLSAKEVLNYYPSWPGRDASMLCFTGAPLTKTFEIAGHPVVTLDLSADQGDASLFVYLEDVDGDGRARHVTEGVLRLLHRKTSPAPASHRVVGPYRSFTRADAAPLESGEQVRVELAMLPVSWSFPAGHRIRLAIAGADADHFMQVPHGRPPVLTISCGESCIELPGVGR